MLFVTTFPFYTLILYFRSLCKATILNEDNFKHLKGIRKLVISILNTEWTRERNGLAIIFMKAMTEKIFQSYYVL